MDYLSDRTAPVYSEVKPWIAVAVTLAAGFIGVMLVRILIEQEFYLLRWWSFRIGDSIGFTIYAYFASRALQNYSASDGWYDRRWSVLSLAGLGIVIGLLLSLGGAMGRQLTWEDIRVPSEFFHSFVTFPILLPMIVHSAIILYFVADGIKSSEKVYASFGLLIYVSAVFYDMVLLPSRHDPGR